MAGNVQQLATPMAQPRDQAFTLDACRALWAAHDVEGIFEAATGLLAGMLPGLHARMVAVDPTSGHFDDVPGNRSIPLSASQRLVIEGVPSDPAALHTLDALLALLGERVAALSWHEAMSISLEQFARTERLQRALYAIADLASAAGGDLTEVFASLHRIVGTLMYAENFYIALYDAAHDGVRFHYYADTVDPDHFDTRVETPMAEIRHGPTWYVIHDGKPLMGSVEELSAQVNGPFTGSGARCVDWLGVPLTSAGKVTGCVVVQSYDALHQFDEQDKSLLIFVAQHIQTALERRFAHAELEHRVGERTEALREANQVLQQQVLERQRGERLQAALFRIAELASTTDRIDDFYATVHRVVGGLLYARNFYIALLSEYGTELTFPYSVDERDVDRKPRKLASGLTEYVLRSGTALLANAREIEKLRARGDVTQHGSDSLCWLGVPLVCTEHTVGALAVQSYSPEHHYTLRDQELLTFVSYHIANALERVRATESLKRAYSNLEHRVGERTRALALANRDLRSQIAERERIEARLKYETLHDALTGLPNRNLLMHRLEQALERYRADPQKSFAVLFMDLDRFKVINDSVGHLIGDDLLFQAGGRIRACLKSEDVVARLGGDEFGVLLEDVPDADTAVHVADRIIASLNAPFRLAGKELFTSTSIGITLAAPHYQHPDELLRDADSAMYRAKSDGRHRCSVFDDNLRRQAVDLLELENDLRGGLSRNEFQPWYQPIIDVERDVEIGYEALLRWHHPQRGVLLPASFLGVAEDGGTAEAIDWQIFEQVCRDCAALTADCPGVISVNVSPRHFRNPELADQLLALLARYGVAPTSLRIEVTERALVENPSEVRRILDQLRAAGITIALDDFGTGYSSLAYLHQYPLQALKIDQSFVANLKGDGEGSTAPVVRAILALAGSLSMQAIAEGVETIEQRDTLRKLGCRYMQGFLYSKAQPAGTWIRGEPAPATA